VVKYEWISLVQHFATHQKTSAVSLYSLETGIAKPRSRGGIPNPSYRSAIGENWLGWRVSRRTDLAKKYPSEFKLPFTASSNWIKGKELRRHDGPCPDLFPRTKGLKKTWEGRTCIVYHTCMKKREIVDKRGNVHQSMGPRVTVPITGLVDDKVPCQANGAAKVVLGRAQKCMAACKVGFVGR
jgi:hypothetical protein